MPSVINRYIITCIDMVNWTAVRGPAGRMKQAMGYVLMIIDTLLQYTNTTHKPASGGDLCMGTISQNR